MPLVRIDLEEGRSDEQEQALYAALAERLHDRCGLRPEDLGSASPR